MGGVSFIEVLILYELWAGERLALETAVPPQGVLSSELFRISLVGWVVSFLVVLAATIGGFHALVGNSVVMA